MASPVDPRLVEVIEGALLEGSSRRRAVVIADAVWAWLAGHDDDELPAGLVEVAEIPTELLEEARS